LSFVAEGLRVRPEAPSTILLLASATSHTTAFGLIHPVGMTSCHPGRTF